MKTDNVFIMCMTVIISVFVFGVVAEGLMKTRYMPTEAEMVMVERMAKLAATAQGECE